MVLKTEVEKRMWRRKNKNPAEQGSSLGRRVQRGGGASPAFSYYTSGASRDSVAARPGPGDRVESGKGRGRRLSVRMSFWLLIAVAAVCLLKVLWLSSSPEVIILGGNSVSATYAQSREVYADAARTVLGDSVTNHSKLTVNLHGTARALEQQFPELQAVSVGVPLISSRPIVYVQVAQPSVILQTGHGNYALNASGIVLAQLRSLPPGIPLLADQSGGKPEPGKQYLPGSTVAFIQTVVYQLEAANLTATLFTQPLQSPYQLDAKLDGMPYFVKFNLQADAKTQSGAAVATIEQLRQSGTVPRDYLDVRVPGRVYYK